MLKSVIQKRTYRQWILVGLTALVFVSLSIFGYWIIQRNQNSFNEFTNARLPSYQAILSLQKSLSDMESLFFQYPNRRDDAYFQSSLKQSLQQYATQLDALEQQFFIHPSSLVLLRSLQKTLPNHAERLTQLLGGDAGAEQAVRHLNTELAPRFQSSRSEITQMVADLNESNVALAASSTGHLKQAVLLALILVFANLAVLLVLMRFNYTRQRALKEQLRLSSYVQNNPIPVYAVSRVGQAIYQNEAAMSVAARWELETLLPDDLESCLMEGVSYSSHEYIKAGRYFELSVSYLNDFQEYHLYVNDVTESKKAEEDLEYLAYHDPITGLVNRQQFCEFVDEALSAQGKPNLTVAILDLDLFDKVVATAGMSVADKVARVAAIRFQRVVTKEPYFNSNSLSYIGGGLFCFAYPKDPVDAKILVQSMKEAAAAPFDIDGFEFYLHLSVGMVSGKHLQHGSSEDALRLADAALKLAKRRGDRSVVVYESWIAERHSRRMEIESGLRAAIQRDEFELFYQPKIALRSGRICGVEALLRWESPGGFISPAEFVPIAEETGQIMEIGQWVVNQACKDVAAWNHAHPISIPVAVNVSAMQLLHTDVANDFLQASRQYDIPLSWLEAEVTETAVIEDFSRALEKLQALHDMGVKVALDDFGTGYSSLSYLQRLPVDVMKIDRSFVQRLRIEALKDESLVESMIGLAHQLGLSVVAEGVETPEQLELLYDWGCEQVQGYLFAKPMPLADLFQFFKEFSPLVRPATARQH